MCKDCASACRSNSQTGAMHETHFEKGPKVNGLIGVKFRTQLTNLRYLSGKKKQYAVVTLSLSSSGRPSISKSTP